MTPKQRIDDFLGQKRIAVVGVSQNPKHMSRMLCREFIEKGYEVVPVNPAASEIDGHPCFPSVRQVAPPVDTVLVMTKASTTPAVVDDCAAAGVKRIWMYRAAGKGAVDPPSVEKCESMGISVIPGECPLMFLPHGAFIHRVHGFVKKIIGTYPN